VTARRCNACSLQVNPSEISSIDFGAMIGGPLTAVINAQAQAAMTTVNFINSVGFHKENRSVVNVDFMYSSTDENGTDVPKRLTVPFLAMLPIPNLEVCVATAVCGAAAVWCCVGTAAGEGRGGL
jgi:hypothetical protein